MKLLSYYKKGIEKLKKIGFFALYERFDKINIYSWNATNNCSLTRINFDKKILGEIGWFGF